MSTPRYRQKSVSKPLVSCTYKNAAGVVYSAGSWSPDIADYTMTDVVDDSFHSRIADGEVFNNACELVVKKSLWSTNVADLVWWTTATPNLKSYWLTGNQTRAALNTAAFPAYDQCHVSTPTWGWEDRAKHLALSRVDSTPYEFFEDLMEIRETLQFLRNPLSAISELAKDYKRALMRKVSNKKVAKDIASLWNQYRFAFSPLVRSLMNGMEAMEKFESLKRPARRTAHGHSMAETPPDRVGHDTVAGTLVRQYWQTSSVQCEGHAAIHYQVSNPLVDWRFALGLRLKDLPKTFWQIMPLSFMVDRLFHVSNMISGLVNLADPTVSILASSFTSRQTKVSKVELWHRFEVNGVTTHSIAHPDHVVYTTYTYKRDPWAPSVYDTIPQLTPKNLVKDITSILDIVSIALSRLL